MNEDLRNWFRDKWVRMNTKGDIIGDCARDEGEGKPKCLPVAKARAMSKDDRAAATRRKRREDPVADRAGKGEKPINVATEEVSTSELIKKSHSKRGAPGTLKAKIQGPLTLAKVRSLKNRANATTLDKKQANFYINMQSEEYLEEKNVPTNPGLWARAKTLARSKFDVYPSAYANGWAAKWYKGKGGSWKSVQEGRKMKTLNDILAEGVAVSSDFKLVNSVNAQGKPITRKVRAHRKTISPQSNESEEKPDVLASIQKFVGRQYDEEVEQIDEVSTDGYHKAAVKSRKENILKMMTSMGSDKSAKTKVDARNRGLKRLSDRTSAEMKKANSGPQKPRVEKEPTEAERRGYGQDRYMGDSYEPEGQMVEAKSASRRMFDALQKVRKQREEEDARKAANEKRALEPKKQSVMEAKDPREYDYEGDMAKTQLRSIIANSQAVHDMLKDTTNLAEWVQSKITKAEDYISTVADYMTAEMNEQTYDESNPKIKAALDKYRAHYTDKTLPAAPQDKKPDPNKYMSKDGGAAGDPKEYELEPFNPSTPSYKKRRTQEEQFVGTANSKDMQTAVNNARSNAQAAMMKSIHGDTYVDKAHPEHDESEVKITADEKGRYKASIMVTPKKPQATVKEAKEDDDEDYTKHHKLDPDSGVEADQHIHVQLKKAIDSTMKPYEVSFKNGKKHTVSSPVAKTIVTAIEKLKPEHRKAVHDELHKSYDSLMAVHKAITGK